MPRPISVTQQLWPQGESEMARRIREHDWAATPLGPPAAWPQSLRTAVDICLGSPFAAAVLWGPEQTLLHNDASIPILVPRYPAALGQPAALAMVDSWAVLGPIVAEVLASGAGASAPSLITPALLAVSVGPVWDGGQPAGVFISALEPAERFPPGRAASASALPDRTLFDAMHEGYARYAVLTDAAGAAVDLRILDVNAAYERLMQRPQPTGKLLHEVEPGLEQEWVDALAAVARSGEPQRFERYNATLDRWFDVTVIPLPGRDRGEIALVFTDITEQKQRAEAALLERDERSRSLLTGADLGLTVIELLHDARGRAVDYRFLEVNDAFAQQTALGDVVGKLGSEVEAADAGRLEIYDEVARSGTPRFFETFHEGTGRWYAVYASSEGNVGSQRVRGVIADITARKRAEDALRQSEEQQVFLLQVSDALRLLTDPSIVQDVAMRMLAEELGCAWACYGEFNRDLTAMTVQRCATQEGLPDLASAWPAASSVFHTPMAAGAVVAVRDIRTDPRVQGGTRAQLDAIGMRAFAAAPMLKDGALRGVVTVADTVERSWTDAELRLITEVTARASAAVEQARAETALRTSETTFRALFESMGDAYWLVEARLDDEGFPIDLLCLEENTRARERNGESMQGRWLSEVSPQGDRHWLAMVAEVLRSAAPRHWEHQSIIDGWYSYHLFPVEGASRRVGIISQDLAARRQTESLLAASEARKTFLLRLSDAVRPLADPLAVQAEASRIVGEHLEVDRAYCVEIDDARGLAVVAHDYVRGSAPSLAGSHPLAMFEAVLTPQRQGRAIACNDASTDPHISEADRAAYLERGLRSFLTVPLIRAGALIATMSVTLDTPRHWTPDELTLLQDVAERTWDAVERARAEDALRDSEERFRTFAEYATDTLWIVNAESGQLECLSPAYDRMWGESREIVMRDLSRWAELVHPEDRARASMAMRRMVAGEQSPLVSEYRIVRPVDGAIRWIHDTGFAFRDAAGIVRRVGGIAQDLTEKTSAETALRQSASMLATVLQTTPVAIGFFGPDGQVLLANPAMHYYLPSGKIPSRDPERRDRWSAHDADGQPVPPEEFPGARAIRGQATVPGLEMRYRDDDGRVT